MAVYERTYKRYAGVSTPQWTRFLVLPRYVFKDVFASKFFLVFYVVCFLPALYFAGRIYLYHNVGKLFTQLPEAAEFVSEYLAIDAESFMPVIGVQVFLAFFTALFVGPGLVSRDLANNGLPLYLSRPFSRLEYVGGKFSVLAILLSAITWVPGLLLYAMQTGYAGLAWGWENQRIALAILVGFGVWITTVSLLALALSAWVRWRPVAGFLMFMVFLVGGPFGALVNGLFSTYWGHTINLSVVMARIWEGLLGLEPSTRLPLGLAWASILVFGAGCVFLLHRKVRAYEVVR